MPSIQEIAKDLEQRFGLLHLTPPPPTFKIPNAEAQFYEAFNYFLNGKLLEPAPEYRQVVEWLSDNQGKSLYLYGNNGRGKTLIATKVLPILFYQNFGKILPCYNATTIADHFNEISQYNLFVIDDIGTEPTETNKYGTKRLFMNEILDQVEKYQKLAIITSNLNGPANPLQPNENTIESKYGIRALERLKGNFRRIKFGENNKKAGEDSFR